MSGTNNLDDWNLDRTKILSLSNLSDVKGSPSGGEVLWYDSSDNTWKPGHMESNESDIATVLANLTRYIDIIGNTLEATEGNADRRFEATTRVVGMSIQIITNTLVDTVTFMIRKNNTDTALTKTIAAGATGLFFVKGLVQFLSTDDFNVRIITNGVVGSILNLKIKLHLIT